MTTTLFLVRHAVHDRVASVLCGRMPGVELGEEGRRQAQALADRFRSERIDAVHTSPLDRARQTAAPIAEALGLRPEIADALDEVDVGEWTGRSFEDLEGNPAWAQWNGARSLARAPGGESMRAVQARAVGYVERVRADRPEGRVVLVSHAEVIRAALLYYLGLSLDAWSRLQVDPASISTLAVGPWGATVVRLNETVAG